MSLLTTLVLTHQLFRLDCYIPNEGIVHRYLKISTPVAASPTRKNINLFQGLILDSEKNLLIDELKSRKESYRVCHIQVAASLFDKSGTSDILMNLEFYKQLSESERKDLMSDVYRLDQVSEEQTNAQIEELKALYQNVYRAKAYPELVKP